MSIQFVALVLSPFLALVVVFGAVAFVALCRAPAEDVPAMLTECVMIFRRLVDRVHRDAARHTVEAEQDEEAS